MKVTDKIKRGDIIGCTGHPGMTGCVTRVIYYDNFTKHLGQSEWVMYE